MSGQSDLVSIVVPVYNAERFIEDTIQTVLNQTYTNWELILVDDRSADKSIELITPYLEKDKRIKLLKNTANFHSAFTRNKGVEAAKGRFIAFLDADDLWLPAKLEKQIAFMYKMDCAFSFTGYEFGNDAGKPNGKKVNVPTTISYKQALRNTTIFTSTVMFDITKLTKHEIHMPDVKRGQDTATWWKVLKLIPYAYGLDQILSVYRRTNNSLSSNKFKAMKRTWGLYRNFERLSLFASATTLGSQLCHASLRRIGGLTTDNRDNRLSLQVLLSTMGRDSTNIVDAMNIRSEVIIINQSDTLGYIRTSNNGYNTLMITMPERGIGLSRNTALQRATADICIFADDDVVYSNEYESRVTKEFEDHPYADIILFNLNSLNTERPTSKTKRFARVRKYNSLRYGTYRMAIRRKRIGKINLGFSTEFGGGAKYSSGEDTIFISQALQNKLKVYASPVNIGTVSHTSSSWFMGYNEKYFLDKGALFIRIFPKTYPLIAVQFVIRKYYLFGTSLTKIEVMRLIIKGAIASKSSNTRTTVSRVC